MAELVETSGLRVDPLLVRFVEDEALAGLDIEAARFWEGLAGLVRDFGPRNRAVLEKRAELQERIDGWHREHGPVAADPEGYEAFLKEIGYLEPEPAPFGITPAEMDPEISSICGPQLVVPVSNARYALNAANARWGSLYDALYGTDAISREGPLAPGADYNPTRGQAVFATVAGFLDLAFPLAKGSHGGATSYVVAENFGTAQLIIDTDAGPTTLKDGDAFVGYRDEGPRAGILLRHNGLHVELAIDREHAIGKTHAAGMADVIVESAVTAIQDCEDSVAAVDAADKVGVYRNWLGLMTGTLSESFEKGGRTVERTLAGDRVYTAVGGAELVLKGRALMLVRNVGHLMTTPAVLDAEGNGIGEGLLDAAVTVLCALHDLKKTEGVRNSTAGKAYVVKPKMHGPEEVALACDLFGAVEAMLGLTPNTVRIGIMDEERRTSANLAACINAARDRLFFINTGFLDRTGDEIHTSMRAGPVLKKDDIKAAEWIGAYEDRNVLIGLSCGLSGVAQIGKGMWAAPDDMSAMIATKVAHPRAGANCAWVPSPTAATLHALHYHEVDVLEAQKRRHNEPTPPLSALFSMPVLDPATLEPDAIQRELENNAQGILGYVVRWVDQGVGCSKVPDINDVALMEDRATCRISSQAIANWLEHGVVSREQVVEAFQRMAAVVDGQNSGDALYRPMAPYFEGSAAFEAALDLALKGAAQPSGYTEPILHAARLGVKAAVHSET